MKNEDYGKRETSDLVGIYSQVKDVLGGQKKRAAHLRIQQTPSTMYMMVSYEQKDTLKYKDKKKY